MSEHRSRSLQKSETRQTLVATAVSLFSSKGIATTTTADIAREAGVSHGTLFLHFRTRDDLILAVMDSVGASLSQALDAALTSPDAASPREVLAAHLRTLSEFEDFYFRLLTEMYALPATVRSHLFMLNANLSWHLYESAKPLIAAGRMKKVPRAQIFNTWMAIVNYTVTHRSQFSNQTPILRVKATELLAHFELLLSLEPQETRNKEGKSNYVNVINREM